MGITAAFAVPHPPLIIPEVGGGKEKQIQKTIDAYQEAAERMGAQRPETIVLLSPHQIMYADYFHISPGGGAVGDFGQFGAGQVKLEVSYDTEFVKELCWQAAREDLQAGTLGEKDPRLDHGTMVPLYFVNQYWRNYRLVRIGLSGLSLEEHYRLGQCIKKTAEKLERRVILIASGDLSHRLKEDGPYGFREEGPAYDRRVMEVLEKGDFGELLEFSEDFCSKAGECGHRSFSIMAGALDQTMVKAEALSYEGPFGVGYGICAYEVCGSDPTRNFRDRYAERRRRYLEELRQKEDAYVRLARSAVEAYVREKKRLSVPQGIPREMLEQQAGVFVSIHKDGRLRGCIGTIQAVQNSVAEEIVTNAISASTRDPRFSPIEPEELERLEITVDVLGEAQRIASFQELDVKRYGVIVSKGLKRGLLLPNLEGVDTVEEQVAIARQKAGIPEGERVNLERFEVVRHF